jgi:hypothetical protein
MSSRRPNLQRGLYKKYIVRNLAFSLSIFSSNTCKCVTSVQLLLLQLYEKSVLNLENNILEEHNYLRLCNKTRRFNTFLWNPPLDMTIPFIFLPHNISPYVIVMLFSIPMVFQVDMTQKAFSSEFCIHVLPPP